MVNQHLFWSLNNSAILRGVCQYREVRDARGATLIVGEVSPHLITTLFLHKPPCFMHKW